MADDKKPKIDLKARLGKQGGGGSVPAPTPMPPGIVPTSRSQPPPQGGGGSGAPAAMPQLGVPVGPPPQFRGASGAPALDPSNPLAAVAAYRPAPVQSHVAHAVHAAPQRIEVDEGAVHEARRGARKTGFVIGMVIACGLGGLGFVAGGALEQGKAREKSKADAASLAEDLGKAKETLTKLTEKMDEGVKTLQGKKFPEKLSADLLGINVGFDGTELAGRRFSGFPQSTTAELVDFITSVQALNDRKLIIEGLLNRLQKPLTERLNAPPGAGTIGMVAAVQKDPSGNPAAFLAVLATPIAYTSASDIKLPASFTFTDPAGQGNATAPRYTGGDMMKNAGAIPIVPTTFEKVCPSEAAGGIAQLQAQIGGFIREIKGEGPPSGDIVTDTKAGLVERADKLIANLQKVQ